MNPSPDDHDPADRLLDALLREQSRHRDPDENLLDAIETALDAQRPGAMNRSGPGSARRGILLAFAAGIAMSAGGFFIWQQTRSSSSAPTLANNDEAPVLKMSSVPRQAKTRDREEPEILASRRMPEPEVMEPNDTLAQADPSSDATATFEAPAAPAPAAALPPLARNALRSATPPAAAVAPVAGASEENTVPAGISEVRFLAWDDATANMKIDIVEPKDNGTLIKELHPLKRTRGYSVDSNSPVKIRIEGRTPPADGTSVDLEVGLQGYEKPLVILMSNEKAPSGLAAVVINDDERNFKWGSYLVFNATAGDIAMVVNKTAFKIPTGWKPVSVVPPAGSGPSVIVQLRTYKEPNKVVYSSIWPTDNDIRTLVVLMPSSNPRLGPIVTKMVPDSKLLQITEKEMQEARARRGEIALQKIPERSQAPAIKASPKAHALDDGDEQSETIPGDGFVLPGVADAPSEPRTKEANAQGLAAEVKPSEQRNVRFLAWDEATAKMAIDLVDGNQLTPIHQLNALKRTGYYPIRNSGSIKLKCEDQLAQGRSQSAAQEVNLNGIRKPLIILLADASTPSGLNVVVIDEDESAFKWGSYVVFNSSKEDVNLKIDGSLVKIPGGWQPVPVTPPASEGTNVPVEIASLKAPQKVLYSTSWPVEENSRFLVVLTHEGESSEGKFAAKAISESRPPAAPVQPVEQAQVRFLAWDDSTAKMAIDLVDGEKAVPISNLASSTRTGFYPATGSLKLRLKGTTRTLADLPVDLKGHAKPLVVIQPDSQSASGLSAVVINDDENYFKWETCQILNSSPNEIPLSVEGREMVIPSGWEPVTLDLRNFYRREIPLLSKQTSERTRTTTLIPLGTLPDPANRRLLVILTGPGPDSAKVISEEKDFFIAQKRLHEGEVKIDVKPAKPAVELPTPKVDMAMSNLPPDPEASRLAGISGRAESGDAVGAGGGRGAGIGSGSGPGAGGALGGANSRASGIAWSGPRPSMGYDVPGSDSQTREPANGEHYGQLIDQPWKSPWKEALSTFSIDVDSASYTNIRRMIREGQPIPPDAVRIEECLNYFDYRYPAPKEGHPFAVQGCLVTSPFRPGALLARVAIKGREIENAARPASNLVFLIDVSGSMQASNKLPLLKRSLEMLVDQLDERDHLGIVVYAGNEGVALEPTKLNAEGKEQARAALRNLEAGGSTNGGAGLRRAYDLAAKGFVAGGVNRVILATDGDFNVGTTSQNDLVELVKEKAKSGVALTVTSVGEGNLNDSMLEAITKDGNGNYYYLDSDNEARRIFLQKLTGTLVTIAKDVKIQVEFNPGKVKAYRLLGYSDRILKHEDFNNDKVDAGDIGAGHTVTAFYEVVPQGAEMPATDGVDPLRYQKPADREIVSSDEWFNLKLRYKAPDGDVSSLIEAPLKGEPQKWENSDLDLRFASSVALFGMKLRQLPEVKDIPWSRVEEMAQPALKDDPREQRAEFIELVKKLAR